MNHAPNTDSGQNGEALKDGQDIKKQAGLTLAALGVVFGDIGTSPIYALRESFAPATGLVPDEMGVLGVLSLAFWLLTIVVTVQYVMLILRADNRGEGGLLSLSILAQKTLRKGGLGSKVVLLLSILGLGLLYGDGLITPSISVLSAVEGLKMVAPSLEAFVLPISTLILILLFLVQRHGTNKVGGFFGPIIFIWFLTIGGLGLWQAVQMPSIFAALNPAYAIALIDSLGPKVLFLLAALILIITGAEALYADLGHFGRKPIQRAWVFLVYPSLVFCYFGQGALVLRDPSALEQPFFRLAPDWFLLPLVILATLATVIASQALITAVFSLTRTAIQLNFLPRMSIRHTSGESHGQIYVPTMNWILLAGVLLLIFGFQTSSNLAHAYGLAVVAAMLITSILAFLVAMNLWRWRWWQALPVFGLFISIDSSFVAASSLKIPSGGWFPILFALLIVLIVFTWRRGQAIVYDRMYKDALPLSLFLEQLQRRPQQRVSGTAIFMTGNLKTIPNSLLHNLKHNKVLHERVILMCVVTAEQPSVEDTQRFELKDYGDGFYTLLLRFGFMETQNIPQALSLCAAGGLNLDLMQTSFFLGRKTLIPSPNPDLPAWQEKIYIALSNSALPASRFYGIPPNRAVELGTLIEI